MSSLPASEGEFSEPSSTFTITSGPARQNNPKLQNLSHLLKLQAEGYAVSGSTTDASKLIHYLDNYCGKMPHTIEKALDTAIANIHEPTGLELVLQIVTKWSDSDLNSYATSQQIFASFVKMMPTAFNMAQLCQLMAKAALNDIVSQSDVLGLSRHIIDFLLRDADAAKKRYPLQLLVGIFKHQSELQSAILDLALQYLRKPLDYVRDQPISKYSDKKISALPVLVLEFIQSVGALPLSTWDEYVAYSRRGAFIEHCKQQIRAADDYTNTVVRVCVEFSQAPTVELFIDDVLMALEAPELCVSETVVRCLTISLLLQCKSFHNRYQLPPAHSFEVLSRIQRPLYQIFQSNASPQAMGQIIDYLLSDGHTTAALYFATLQCKDKDKAADSWRDFHMRFTNPQARSALPPKKWIQVLKAGKIGSLYQHTVDVMLILSESGVPGPAYIEILKSLCTVVYEHPSFFKKIEAHLMSQLEAASSFVCDWTAHIVSNYIAATDVDFSLVARTMVRISGPGNLSYKKRCIKLLDQAFSSPDTTLQTLAWKYLLILSDDPKASVAQQASKTLCQYIENTPEVESLCSIFQQILRLGPKYGTLISSVLCKPLDRKAVHRLVSYLLQSLDSTPDYQQLKIASLFIAANGLYLPPSKVPILVNLSVCGQSKQGEHRLLILKMLEAALTSKPRIILSPKVVSGLYKKMLGMLAVYTEPEIECAGRIIWELASLGRDEEKRTRKNELITMYQTCLNALTSCNTRSTKVLSHLCSIVGVGARVWAQSTDCIPVLLNLVENSTGELRLQAIRALCRVCTRSPNLFLEGPCRVFFDSVVFKNESGPEWNQFMAVFLEFLESQDQKAQRQQQQKLTADVLHGHDKLLVAESTLGGLFQTYFGALEACALASDSSSSVTAARLLCRGIITSKVDSSSCTATVVALCCSRNVEISQVAHECFSFLMERGQLNGFAKGLAAAGLVTPPKFKRVWEELREEHVQAALMQLVENFMSSKEFAVSVYDGLALAALLRLANARYLEEILDESIYNFSADSEYEALLIVLRAVIQYKYAAGDSTAELTIPSGEFVVEKVDPEDLRDAGDYKAVLEHVASLDTSKRRRLHQSQS